MKNIITIGVVLLIAVSVLFRGLYFALEASAFLTAIAFLAVLYFLIKLSKKEEMYFNKWLLILGSLLLVAYIISFINAANARENITALIQFTEYLIVSIVLFDYYHDKKQKCAWIVMIPVLIIGFFNAIISIEALTGAFSLLDVFVNGSRVRATFQYANTAAIYFTICLLFSLSLINTSVKLILRILFTGIGNTILLAMLLTGSRGGYIVAAFVFIIYFFIQPVGNKLKSIGSFICIALPAFIFLTRISALQGSQNYILISQWLLFSFLMAFLLGLCYELFKKLKFRIRIKPVWSLLIFLAITTILVIAFRNEIAGILPENIIQRFASISLSDVNIYLRLQFDKWALSLISENWLIGRGGGAWDALYQSVQEIFFGARSAHNHYFQVFIESGILGFLSFLGIILVSLWNMFYSLIKTNDVKNKVYISGLFCGFLALVIHSSFDFNLTFVSLALIFWVLIAGAAIFLPEISTDKVKKNKAMLVVGNNAVKYILVILCSILLSLNGLYTASAYYADRGYHSMVDKNFPAARASYEKASSLDTINPVYHFQLAKIYNYYSKMSAKPENMQAWREKARVAAERSVALNSFYPEYREILIQIDFDSGMPLEALDNAEKLIKCQPLNIKNFEQLARAYLESADYYIKNQNIEKGKEQLLLCSQINLNNLEESEAMSAYRDKASNLLGKY